MHLDSSTLLHKALACLLLYTPSVVGQGRPTDFSTWYNVTEFPNPQAANVSLYQAEAQALATGKLWYDYVHRCINSQKYPTVASNVQVPGWVTPQRAFDNAIFVGYSSVSSWAIETSDGLILIDALNNAEEAQRVITPALEAFGYSGEDIKALVVTHEHFDHYGGAAWIQDTFKTPVYGSEAFWSGLAGVQGAPKKDKVIKDDGTLTVGKTTIRTYLTPGHSNGTISMIIPVYERGQKHLAGLYGGGGIPRGAQDKAVQINSFSKFAKLAERLNVDVLISNHQTQDHTLQNLDILTSRQCDKKRCSSPNPSILGTKLYVQYLRLMAKCVQLSAAREGQNIPRS
ncbi:hypothetical protein F66182_3718 [Fusarium sp. NRRL 66182]|nr:hypothetical protein F66182_3718 [Fusarium sp. NRRL 66182]